MCEIQDCGVCECKRPGFLSEKDVENARESNAPCQRQLSSHKLIHASANGIFSKPWTTSPPDKMAPEMKVINLLANPEVYTGYKGSKVWVRLRRVAISEVRLRRVAISQKSSEHVSLIN